MLVLHPANHSRDPWASRAFMAQSCCRPASFTWPQRKGRASRFGIIPYGFDADERWRVPLGPCRRRYLRTIAGSGRTGLPRLDGNTEDVAGRCRGPQSNRTRVAARQGTPRGADCNSSGCCNSRRTAQSTKRMWASRISIPVKSKMPIHISNEPWNQTLCCCPRRRCSRTPTGSTGTQRRPRLWLGAYKKRCPTEPVK